MELAGTTGQTTSSCAGTTSGWRGDERPAPGTSASARAVAGGGRRPRRRGRRRVLRHHRRREPGALVRSLVEHLDVPPEDRVPAIADFLAAAGRLPEWADPGRMARGQGYFADWALHQFTALYLASLPSAYAAARGVHVLWLTARLEQDPERRLNETAQFLMDVTAPGGFSAGGSAIDRVLHVRLMHAAVRWLIDHSTAVKRPADADPAPRRAGRRGLRRGAGRQPGGPGGHDADVHDGRPRRVRAQRRRVVHRGPRTSSTCGR